MKSIKQFRSFLMGCRSAAVPGAPHTVLMAVDWEDSSSSSSRWAVGRIWRHRTWWVPNLPCQQMMHVLFYSAVWFKRITKDLGHECYLLRQLTDEVLGKLLELVPLQPWQRLRDWSPQTHCWCLHATQTHTAWSTKTVWWLSCTA